MEILIIEDDLGIPELIRHRLEKENYNLVFANSAKSALKRLKDNAPDMIILDFALPDMNGIELINHMISENIAIPPFIVTTGMGDERTAVDMMKFGARDYLIKDIHFLDLLPEIVKKVITDIEKDRKRADTEKALDNQSKMLNSIFDNAPYILMLVDRELRVKNINHKGILFSGKSKKLILGLLGGDVTNCIHASEGEGCGKNPNCKVCAIWSNVNYTFKQNEPIIDEEGLIEYYQDGKIESLNISVSTSIVDVGDEKLALLSIADISKRKKIEEALLNNERRLLEAQKIAKLGHYNFNIVEGRWYSSLVLDEIFGMGKDFEKTIEGWLEIIHPDYKEEMLDYLSNHVIKNQNKFNKEYKIITIDTREEKWVRGLGGLKFDNDGNSVEMFGTIQDITTQKQAEEKIKESEERFRMLSEQSVLGIFIGQDNVIKYINQAAADIFEYTIDEILNWTPSECFEKMAHPDDRAFIMKEAQNKETGEQDYRTNYHFKALTKSGAVKHIEKYSKPILYSNRNAVLSVINDISERKRAENALLNNEAKQSAMIANISDVIAILDDKGIILYKSPNIEKHFGWKPEELIGKQGLDQSHPDDYELIKKAFVNVLKEHNATVTVEYRYRCKNGEYAMIQLTAVNLLNDPNINGILTNYHDISERKKTEKELNTRQFYLSKAQEIGSIGTWELDIETNELIWTEQNYKNFGVPLGTHVTYDKFIQCIHPADREYVHKEWITALKNNKQYDIEHRVLANGKVKWLREKADITFDENGKAIVAIGVTQDITERKVTEQELQKLAKLESLGLLAGGIAHNFKNILANISFNISLAKYKPESTKTYLDKMEAAIGQASALATRFQTFSTGGDPLIETISLKNVLDEALAIGLSGSEIISDLVIEDDIWNIRADARQLNEVFMNLIINAKQAMPKGGRLDISANNLYIDKDNVYLLNEGPYVKISFRDSGIGIAKEKLPKIFDPFYTNKASGTGLGLASVQLIIKKHKGAVTVNSKLNMWTQFEIYLPATDEGAKFSIDLQKQIIGGQNRRILYVDDDALLRDNIAEMGEIIDYRIDAARDGDEAIQFYKKAADSNDPYCAVILDLTLQGSNMQGEEVLKELKKINREVKAIVFSGHSTKPIVANYWEYGFVGRLDKPITIEKLSQILEKVHN